MSEPAPDAPAAPMQKPKRKIGFKQKMALLAVIERKRIGDRVDYKAIAARTGVPQGSIRQLYSQWTKGTIDLGDPTTPEEKAIDARVQHERTIELLRRYKALILNGFEATLLDSEDDMTNGKPHGWKERGMPAILRELKSVTDLETLHEKGYNSILDDAMAARNRETKALADSPVPIEVQTQVIHANDEEKAMAALREHGR
jgi:hypothetical protein